MLYLEGISNLQVHCCSTGSKSYHITRVGGGPTEWLHPDSNLWLHQSEQHSLAEGRGKKNQTIHLHTAVPINSKPDSLKVYSTANDKKADNTNPAGGTSGELRMEDVSRRQINSSCGSNFNEQLYALPLLIKYSSLHFNQQILEITVVQQSSEKGTDLNQACAGLHAPAPSASSSQSQTSSSISLKWIILIQKKVKLVYGSDIQLVSSVTNYNLTNVWNEVRNPRQRLIIADWNTSLSTAYSKETFHIRMLKRQWDEAAAWQQTDTEACWDTREMAQHW